MTQPETSVASVSQASTTEVPLVPTVTYLTVEVETTTQTEEISSSAVTESTVPSTIETTAGAETTTGKALALCPAESIQLSGHLTLKPLVMFSVGCVFQTCK